MSLTRLKRKSDLHNDGHNTYKLEVTRGSYPWEYLNAISLTIGSISTVKENFRISDELEELDDVERVRDNNCVVCLHTAIYMALFTL